jgi:lantibiotic modifying enzyme
MGASLYNGVAGVALFLAEIARLTGNSQFSETAAGAARQAQRLMPVSSGFYSGGLGVAFSLFRVRECLDEPELGQIFEVALAEALKNLDRAALNTPLDVIGGSAGSILALLSIYNRMPAPSLLEAAMHQGWLLCENADWTDDYCNWRPDAQEEGHFPEPLSGLSHGSSGIGASLLTLAAKTGGRDFLITGRGAFAYDNTLFRDEHRLWIDMRSNRPDSRNVAEAWCHGAGGIALARILAMESDYEERATHKYYAGVAAKGVERNLNNHWMRPGENTCLCHGALGACDVLTTASIYGLGDNLAEAAGSATKELILRHDATGDWPSNPIFSKPHLGLLMGLAGIGHGLLRVAYPDKIESILMVR